MGARCRLQAPGWSHGDPQRTLEGLRSISGDPRDTPNGFGSVLDGFLGLRHGSEACKSVSNLQALQATRKLRSRSGTRLCCGPTTNPQHRRSTTMLLVLHNRDEARNTVRYPNCAHQVMYVCSGM